LKDELSEVDKKYMEFGRSSNSILLDREITQNRSMQETLNLGWALLSTLPVTALDRLDPELIKKNYDPEHAERTIQLVLSGEGEA